MAELKVTKSRRGIARASITRLKKHIIKFEDKPELSKVDRQTVQSLIKNVQSLDDTFKEHHYVIADEAEEDAVETEQRSVRRARRQGVLVHEQALSVA